jgi:hypothetical protein
VNALEVVKLIVSAATPIVVVILGILLLRRIEGVKVSAAMESDFRKRWAASTCLKLVGSLVSARQGNVDEISGKMDSCNEMARMAHAEMIGVAGQSGQGDAEDPAPHP